MNIEKQVCSLWYAKRLKELGITQNAYWSWYINAGKGNLMHNPEGYRSMEEKTFDAFSVAELGKILRGHELPFYNDGRYSSIAAPKRGWRLKQKRAESTTLQTEADARADLLIYLIETSNFCIYCYERRKHPKKM